MTTKIVLIGRYLALVLGLVLIPALGTAQALRGTVTDEAGQPTKEALVTVSTGAGVVVARAVSDSEGRYSVQLPQSGSFTVRVLRIGFSPSKSITVTVADRETTVVPLVASAGRIQLATFRIQGVRSCGTVGFRSVDEQTLWEQAVASLAAAGQSLQRPLRATTLLIDRTLDARGRRTLRQNVVERNGTYIQPWRSVSADSLRRRGYVWVENGDSLAFIAPSIEVLLSQVFFEDHCFSPRFNSDRSEIGIEFTPIPSRANRSEIRGALWLSTMSGELERLEFSFTGVPGAPELSGSQSAGGELRFKRLADRSTHIVDWEIRIPSLAVRDDSVRDVRVMTVQVSAGRTILLRQGNDTLFRHPTGSITGRIRDSRGRRVSNASVWIQGASRTVMSDHQGNFAFSDLLPGTYQLRVATPEMRALSRDTSLDVTLLDSATAIDVRVPTSVELAQRFCEAQGVGLKSSAENLLAGFVLPDSQYVRAHAKDGSSVFIRWSHPALRGPDGSPTSRAVEIGTDSSGAFQLCGLPAGASVTVRAAVRSTDRVRRSAIVRLVLPTDSVFSQVTVPIGRSSSAALTIGGIVTDSTQRPIAEAEVSTADGRLITRTDARGVFLIRDLPDEAVEIRVRKLGYEAWSARVPQQLDDSVTLKVTLRRLDVLASVSTIAPRSSSALQLFETNRRMGIGRFFTAEDLRRADGSSMNTVLAQVPGLRLLTGSGGRLWPASSRSAQGTATLAQVDRMNGAQRACYVKVYRDGALLFGGAANEPLFDLSTVRVEELEAIEFYAGGSQVPSVYSGLDVSCGVLALWTRLPPDR